MSRRNKIITAVLSTALWVAATAIAGNSELEVNQRVGICNPVAGRDKSILCQGCHGEDGNSVASNFPRLAGQYATYIQRQIKNFGEGSRNDVTMTDIVSTITNSQDSCDIASYFASQKLMVGTSIKSESEKELYNEGKKIYTDSHKFRCINCHGEYGKGAPYNNPMFPIIGGQEKNYLFKQLIDFRKNTRNTDISETMNELTKQMSASEISAVSQYLSAQ